MTQDTQQKPAPQIQILTQYVRDLSFENPNAPESLLSNWPAPETSVQVFLGHRPIKEDVYEVVLHFRVEAKKKDEDKVAFLIDLHYAAVAVLQNVPAENHLPVVMIEVPKLAFPYAREIISNLTASGGYPPLYLAPVNFEAIFIQEMKRREAEAKEGGAKKAEAKK